MVLMIISLRGIPRLCAAIWYMVCHVATQYQLRREPACRCCIGCAWGWHSNPATGSPCRHSNLPDASIALGGPVSDAARIVEVAHGDLTPARLAQVDAIFFETSGRGFPSAWEGAVFRERWLGRFLKGGTDVVLLALDPTG